MGYDAKTLRRLAWMVEERWGEIMEASPFSAERLSFDDDQMWVTLSDGRTLGVLLAWFPGFSPPPRPSDRVWR
jgi:hypothetical protein